MKPHPRIRKTLKWGGAILTGVLLFAWIESGFWAVCCSSPRGIYVAVNRGCLSFGTDSNLNFTAGPMFDLDRGRPFDWTWMVEWLQVPRYQWYRIPLWIPFAISLATCVNAWRLDTLARRRAHLGRCPKCNYDRTGLAPQVVCPECGAAALAPSPPA